MKYTVKRAAALIFALVFICLCACGCGLDSVREKIAGESETDPVTTTTEAETEPVSAEPDRNFEPVPGGEKFVCGWHDKYSNRCDMIISHIGGNYYDINLWWGSSAESAICMSFVGTYSAETDSLDYTGTEYELSVSDSDVYSTYIINDKCEGSFSFKNEETLIWSERSECRFIAEGDTYEGGSFAKVVSPDETVCIMSSTGAGDSYGEEEAPSVITAVPAGVIVNVIETEGDYTLVAYGPFEGYVLSENLADTGLVYSKPAVTVMLQDDLEDGKNAEPDYVDSDGYYAQNVAFIAGSEVTQLSFISISLDGENEDGSFVFDAERLYTAQDLSRPVIIRLKFDGDIPGNGISYTDDAGEAHDYALEQSGRDGSLILTPITAVYG